MNVKFELMSTKLTGNTKKVVNCLIHYRSRMKELGREPVLRVRKANYTDMFKFAKANTRDTDTVTTITLGGQEVLRYDGE